MRKEQPSILQDQISYYRARAREYDEWFFRQGRYDRGDEQRNNWFSEVSILEKALRGSQPNGKVLELACGTGIWTRHLASFSNDLTAVDVSPEVIAINRQRVGLSNVHYVEADLFEWEPDSKFDFVFFAFWLSHVPRDRFDNFWQSIRNLLNPGGTAFLVDSLFQQESTAKDHPEIDRSGVAVRQLNDGRQFRIVKVFYEPGDLRFRLERRGWLADIRSTGSYFLYGTARRRLDP